MSHNSANAPTTGEMAGTPDLPFKLTGTQAKTKHCIELNVERMAREAGVGFIGFLTLTVGDLDPFGNFHQVHELDEANRRVNNLARRLLPSIFKRWVIVTERHKNGAVHFHLCVEMPFECREGYDWEAVRGDKKAGVRPDYSSANPALRCLWAYLRAELPKFGFGRHQLEPAKGAESMARYVAKYVEKNLFCRLDCDKGKKMVRYGGWQGKHCRPCDIAWATPRAAAWRENLQNLAARADIFCLPDVPKFFGPKWAWRFTKIMGAPEHQQSSWLEMAMGAFVREQQAERYTYDAFVIEQFHARRERDAFTFDGEMIEAWKEVA